MCGIFAEFRKQGHVNQHILDGLKALEYRGYDSWGVAVIAQSKKTSLAFEKHIGKISQSELCVSQSLVGVGHTRWATHGGVTEENSHPHADCSKNIAVVQNGIIENYLEIKANLKKKHTFRSQTDTEIFSHLVEELIEKHDFFDAVRLAFQQVKGWNAVIVLNGMTKEIVAVRKGSPLVLGISDKATFLVSDPHALLPHTKQMYYLEDEEFVYITADSTKLYDINGIEKKLVTTTLNLQSSSTNKGEYEHFMLKEINEEPTIILKAMKTPTSVLGKWKTLSQSYNRIVFLGCGTAYHAAMMGKLLAQSFLQVPAEAVIASEWQSSLVLAKNTLPIFLSQSGETIDVLEGARYMKSKHMKLAAFVNVEGSSLCRMVDMPILLEAGPEIGVLATKSFIAKLSKLFLLLSFAQGKEAYTKMLKEMQQAVEYLKKTLQPSFIQTYIEPVTQLLAKHHHAFVLGRGLTYPLALETALKIKEGSYVHAEGFAAGELKHGVIALVEHGTPCMLFVAEDDSKAAMLANAMEIKARGGVVIGISQEHEQVFDYWIQVKDCGVPTILIQAAVGQLLGYYTALKLGRDIDKPRNLAKSVTVK